MKGKDGSGQIRRVSKKHTSPWQADRDVLPAMLFARPLDTFYVQNLRSAYTVLESTASEVVITDKSTKSVRLTFSKPDLIPTKLELGDESILEIRLKEYEDIGLAPCGWTLLDQRDGVVIRRLTAENVSWIASESEAKRMVNYQFPKNTRVLDLDHRRELTAGTAGELSPVDARVEANQPRRWMSFAVVSGFVILAFAVAVVKNRSFTQ